MRKRRPPASTSRKEFKSERLKLFFAVMELSVWIKATITFDFYKNQN